MPLANGWAERSAGGEAEIVAMAFRDDRSAERVTISNLSFDGCAVASAAKFTVGERLRLHVRGQGWIEAQVQATSDGVASVVFMTRCLV